MKIPKNKVPAQVWAEKVERNIDAASFDERACLMRWKGSKQVYRVNDNLWRELSLEDAAELPVDVFTRLPYDCIFIQHRKEVRVSNGQASLVLEREGYFCWLDGSRLSISVLTGTACRVEGPRFTAKGEIRPLSSFIFDIGHAKTIGGLLEELEDTTLAGAQRAAGQLAEESGNPGFDATVGIDGFISSFIDGLDLKQVFGCLMYIASKGPDVRTVYAPQKSQPRKSRQADCTVHDVGFRVAPQLAEVRRCRFDGGDTSENAGRDIAPHVRRAHWHGYWTGPRENPTGLEIKWIALVVVNGHRGKPEGVIHDFRKKGLYAKEAQPRDATGIDLDAEADDARTVSVCMSRGAAAPGGETR